MVISRQSVIPFLGIIIVLAAAVFPASPVQCADNDESFRRSFLTIETIEGAVAFDIEIAETAAQRAQGLQFRRTMAANQGMLFDFGSVGPVTMWMKNTVLSLDMLFVDGGGKIVHIEKATEPYSLKFIGPKMPVRAVLELLAGTSDRHRLRVGDLVRHPIFE